MKRLFRSGLPYGRGSGHARPGLGFGIFTMGGGAVKVEGKYRACMDRKSAGGRRPSQTPRKGGGQGWARWRRSPRSCRAALFLQRAVPCGAPCPADVGVHGHGGSFRCVGSGHMQQGSFSIRWMQAGLKCPGRPLSLFAHGPVSRRVHPHNKLRTILLSTLDCVSQSKALSYPVEQRRRIR